MFKIAYPRQRSMIEESSCVVLPYFKIKYDPKDSRNDYGLMDYGAAWTLVENILLAATAEGLGSCLLYTSHPLRYSLFLIFKKQ